MAKYRISLEVETGSYGNPRKWDWPNLIETDNPEDLDIVEMYEITSPEKAQEFDCEALAETEITFSYGPNDLRDWRPEEELEGMSDADLESAIARHFNLDHLCGYVGEMIGEAISAKRRELGLEDA